MDHIKPLLYFVREKALELKRQNAAWGLIGAICTPSERKKRSFVSKMLYIKMRNSSKYGITSPMEGPSPFAYPAGTMFAIGYRNSFGDQICMQFPRLSVAI
jgi:hypothetical protein